MSTLTSPSFALRPQRDGARQKHIHAARPRAAGQALGALNAAGATAMDSVFKRFPSIGDIPSSKQRW
jgi:hypothetical protein